MENLELTLKAYDASNSHDWDAFVAFVDEDVEVDSRLGAMEGGYHGHAGSRQWWDALFGAMPDYSVEIRSLRDLGDVTLARSHGLGHGAASATPVIDRFWHALDGATERSSGGATVRQRPKPSKPWACGSSSTISSRLPGCWPTPKPFAR